VDFSLFDNFLWMLHSNQLFGNPAFLSHLSLLSQWFPLPFTRRIIVLNVAFVENIT
jgi:hypothetical protein